MDSWTRPTAAGDDDDRWSWLRLVIDEIDYGIALLREGRVACLNRVAAARLADPGCPLRLDGDTLSAAGADDERAWRTALHEAAVLRRRQLMALRRGGDSLPLALIPLQPGHTPGAPGAVMLVMGKRGVCAQLSANWFCRQHGLTPAESRVLCDLLDGVPTRTIAQRHGVALSTVRTQISNIKGKTAIRGLRQLVVAAAALPPVAPVVVPRPAYS
jgi:DNA-binding CsgD family transcriptional regulator